jgi:transcriptional regulator with XRE-family HTH domain
MEKENQKAILVELGQIIKKLRLKQGISQEELAERASVHRTYIGMIERGEKNLTVTTIIKIAQALNIKSSVLLEGINDGK